MIVHSWEVIAYAWNNFGGMAEFIPNDEQFAEPSEDWINNVLGPTFLANVKAQGLDSYSLEDNDCDDWTIEAWSQARRMHSRTIKAQGLKRVGLAFGKVNIPVPGGRHLQNWAFINGVIRPWEAQTQRFTEWTDDQKVFAEDPEA